MRVRYNGTMFAGRRLPHKYNSAVKALNGWEVNEVRDFPDDEARALISKHGGHDGTFCEAPATDTQGKKAAKEG